MAGVVRLLAVLAVAACSPGVGSDAPPTAAPDAGSMGGTGDPRGLERFVGRAGTSPTVPFGGDPYCDYSITLKNIVAQVLADPQDGLVAMVVADTTSEAIVGTCPYAPAAMTRQVFEHTGGALAWSQDNTVGPNLQGNASNSPEADLGSILTREKDGSLTATLRWQRTDQTPPLDWTVLMPAPLVLERVACETGDIYCIGGSLAGTEYGCVDGTHLVVRKPCASGCGPASTAVPHEDELCN